MNSRRLRQVAILAFLATSSLAASEQEVLDRTFDSNGTEIRYLAWGQGDPLVLIHGFSGNVEREWIQSGIVKTLAPAFKVIALDCRGHGKSGKPHDPEAYGIEMVEDVIRLLDHLEIERAHVAGYSMGGLIAIKMLTTAPERLLSAVVGGAGWAQEGDPIQRMLAELAESLEEGRGFGPLLEALTPEGAPSPGPEQLALINQFLTANNDTVALAAAVRGFPELQIPEAALRANAIPTLAIVGSLDPVRERVEALRRVMSNLEVRILDGATHATAISSPEMSQGILDFVIALCKCA